MRKCLYSSSFVASVSQILSHLLWFGGWYVTSEAQLSLALIQSPTQKIGIGLLVKLQAMIQLTTSVTTFEIRRVQSYKYRYRSSLVFYYSSIALIAAVIICQVALSFNQILQADIAASSHSSILLTQFCLIGYSAQQRFSSFTQQVNRYWLGSQFNL